MSTKNVRVPHEDEYNMIPRTLQAESGNFWQISAWNPSCRGNNGDGKAFRLVLSRYVSGKGVTIKQRTKMEAGKVPLLSTDVNQPAEEIIEEYGQRFSIEEIFKDLKKRLFYNAA